MKKYLFIFGLVGTALFTACSTADDVAADKPIETPSDDQASITTLIAEASQNSEVPITLGVGESRGLTRKPLDPSDAYGNFNTPDGKYLGVFCLATGTQSGVSNIPSVINANNWNTTGDDGELIVWLKNEPAKVVTSTTCDVKFVDPSNTSIEKVHYYPMTNWMKYNFYAYYPRQGDETLSFTPNQALQTNYVIDGSQDIIWGMSDQANAPSLGASDAAPYCAKYSRLAKKKVAEEGGDISVYYPKFTFEHKLVQFRFFVKAADATALTTLKGLSAKVTDMYIANAYYNLRLIVANKANPEYNGTLSKSDNSTKNLRIKKDDSDANRFDQNGDETVDNPLTIKVSKVDVTSYPATTFTAETAAAYNATLAGAVSAGSATPADFATRVGHPAAGVDLTAAEAIEYNATLAGAVAAGNENGFVGYIMLPRPEALNVANFKYQLVLKLDFTGGSNLVAIDLEPPASGFEEGKIYNVIVNVQSPEQIFATAVLSAWELGDSNNDGAINASDVIEYVSD